MPPHHSRARHGGPLRFQANATSRDSRATRSAPTTFPFARTTRALSRMRLALRVRLPEQENFPEIRSAFACDSVRRSARRARRHRSPAQSFLESSGASENLRANWHPSDQGIDVVSSGVCFCDLGPVGRIRQDAREGRAPPPGRLLCSPDDCTPGLIQSVAYPAERCSRLSARRPEARRPRESQH